MKWNNKQYDFKPCYHQLHNLASVIDLIQSSTQGDIMLAASDLSLTEVAFLSANALHDNNKNLPFN